jgi:hypothetical protein
MDVPREVINAHRVCIADHVVARPVLGEMVLLDLASEQYFALNDVGARMWDLFSAGQTVAAVAASLGEEYEVAPDVLQADIGSFLSKIFNLGFATGSAA